MKLIDSSSEGEIGRQVFPCALPCGIACQYAAFLLVAVFNPEGGAGDGGRASVRQPQTEGIGRRFRQDADTYIPLHCYNYVVGGVQGADGVDVSVALGIYVKHAQLTRTCVWGGEASKIFRRTCLRMQSFEWDKVIKKLSTMPGGRHG